MGYYTKYEFGWFFLNESIIGKKEKRLKEINLKEFMYNMDCYEHLLYNHSNKTDQPVDFDLVEIVSPEQKMKWYSHEEDMMNLTGIFPDLVFVLKGEGEDSGDSWIKIFHDGNQSFYQEQRSYKRPKDLPSKLTEKIKNAFCIEYTKEENNKQ